MFNVLLYENDFAWQKWVLSEFQLIIFLASPAKVMVAKWGESQSGVKYSCVNEATVPSLEVQGQCGFSPIIQMCFLSR